MRYYSLLMRRIYNRILREMIGVNVWVTVNTYGIGSGRQNKATLNYNLIPGVQFKILPIYLDMNLLDMFAQWYNYGNIGSINPEQSMFRDIKEAMELLEEYPI